MDKIYDFGENPDMEIKYQGHPDDRKEANPKDVEQFLEGIRELQSIASNYAARDDMLDESRFL